MDTNREIKVCGSVVKEESLIPVEYNILEGTCIAEANSPYSNYYGNVPKLATPNSIFLFTKHSYSLEEVLRFAQNIDSCYMTNVNVAAASLEFGHDKYSAIRIKYFPDYDHIHLLQSCFINEGVEFIKKVHMSKFALLKIHKCFVLEELEEGIYIDKKEKHRGYIAIPKHIDQKYFLTKLSEIRNNNDCALLDAVLAAMIIDSKATDMLRIYSEKVNLELLKCVKEKFTKSIM
jgi:hypothetical protein